MSRIFGKTIFLFFISPAGGEVGKTDVPFWASSQKLLAIGVSGVACPVCRDALPVNNAHTWRGIAQFCQLMPLCGIGGKTQPVATPSVAFRPGTVLGIQGEVSTFNSYPGIPWVRLSYPTCVASDLHGQVLKDTISTYHTQGIHILLTYCQTNGASLFDMNRFNDVAQAGADAVQCGNEQMKQSATTLYVTPDRFARFFDLCQSAVHAQHPTIPVILGSMDPLVVPDDDAKLMNQVHYLDAMQSAMNA